MSYYDKHWSIDGVTAGPISEQGLGSGQYSVLFEREFASLEQIETINWARPSVEYLGRYPGVEKGLPEGYEFSATRITYDSALKTYAVQLQTGAKYLGDVTEYQAQVETLSAQLAEADDLAITLYEEYVATTEAAEDTEGEEVTEE